MTSPWCDHMFNPLFAELNPTCHLLALLGAHHILHVRRIRVNVEISNLYFNSLFPFIHKSSQASKAARKPSLYTKYLV